MTSESEKHLLKRSYRRIGHKILLLALSHLRDRGTDRQRGRLMIKMKQFDVHPKPGSESKFSIKKNNYPQDENLAPLTCLCVPLAAHEIQFIHTKSNIISQPSHISNSGQKICLCLIIFLYTFQLFINIPYFGFVLRLITINLR